MANAVCSLIFFAFALIPSSSVYGLAAHYSDDGGYAMGSLIYPNILQSVFLFVALISKLNHGHRPYALASEQGTPQLTRKDKYYD